MTIFFPCMFDSPFETKITNSKSNLKNILRVDICHRIVNASSLVVDGSAVLWTTAWPTKGTVNNFTTNISLLSSFPSLCN